MFNFNLFQFIEQFVVFRITDDRRVEYMITMIVKMDLPLEFLNERIVGR